MAVGAACGAAGVESLLRWSRAETITSVQEDIRPLIAKANALADEASKTATLATAQAQKIDRWSPT